MSDEIIPSPEGESQLSTDPKRKLESIFEKMEMMALKQSDGGIDLKSFSDTQKDKLLEVLQKNEDHAFEYHTEKLKSDKEIRLAEINAGTFQLKNARIFTIAIILAITAVTIFIAVNNDAYLMQWLTFVTGLVGGLLGGYGIGRSRPENKKAEEE